MGKERRWKWEMIKKESGNLSDWFKSSHSDASNSVPLWMLCLLSAVMLCDRSALLIVIPVLFCILTTRIFYFLFLHFSLFHYLPVFCLFLFYVFTVICRKYFTITSASAQWKWNVFRIKWWEKWRRIRKENKTNLKRKQRKRKCKREIDFKSEEKFEI